MASAALLITNLADAGTLVASSAAANMPISQLIDSAHVTDDLWRSETNSDSFTLDLLADRLIDTVAVLGMTVATSATIRLKISTSAAGVGNGNVLDTGILTNASVYFDPNYGMFVYRAAAPVTGRYIDVALADASASYVEAGRIVVGLSEVLSINFAFGSTTGWADPSAIEKSKGLQTLIWQRAGFRTAMLDLQWVENSQRWGVIETMGRVNGGHTDILTILDTAADNLPQWTIWGLVKDLSPAAFIAIPDVYSKQLQIEERR